MLRIFYSLSCSPCYSLFPLFSPFFPSLLLSPCHLTCLIVCALAVFPRHSWLAYRATSTLCPTATFGWLPKVAVVPRIRSLSLAVLAVLPMMRFPLRLDSSAVSFRLPPSLVMSLVSMRCVGEEPLLSEYSFSLQLCYKVLRVS